MLAGLLRRHEVSGWWWPVRRWAGQAGEAAVAGRGVVRGGGYAAGGSAAAAGVVELAFAVAAQQDVIARMCRGY